MIRFFLLLLSCFIFHANLIAQSEEKLQVAHVVSDTLTAPSSMADTLNADTLAADSIVAEPILFTPEAASAYIVQMLQEQNLWKSAHDTMKLSLSRLLDHYHEPFDSVRSRLHHFHYDSVELTPTQISHHDTLPVKWLNDHTFMVDTFLLPQSPVITQKTIVLNKVDTTALINGYKIPEIRLLMDSLLSLRDTIMEVVIDSVLLESRGVVLHQVQDGQIDPPLLRPGRRETIRFAEDSAYVVISRRQRAIRADEYSPFHLVPNPKMPDSLQQAVNTLLDYSYARDSVLLYITNVDGRQTPFWLSQKQDEMTRFWVKNMANDSITLWIGNPERNEILLALEDNVSVERRQKISAEDIPISTLSPRRTLADMTALDEIPIFWSYGLGSALTVNQTYFSHWAQGGENSLATTIDVRAEANYTHTEKKIRWTNQARLRYGSIKTEDHGFRTNTDNLEFNSQFNTDLREKLDFSSVFYFRTQIAKGYNYPNDSVVVSKFLNPGSFTLGAGVEYTPFKNNTINFSALSYRNTFVLDTASINQTAHGIEKDKRARHELGGQLVLRNRLNITEDFRVNSVMRLFSSYLEKPKNVDLDWEVNFEKQINWYFMIRLNIHMIYDDAILFPVLDKNDEPVLLPDGTPKKSPNLQFKQFLGVTLSFSI